MVRERLRRLLNEALDLVGIEKDNIRLVLYPMKRKIASVSLRTRIIRLNKNIVWELDNEDLKYILVHEVIHLKIGSTTHNERFWQELLRLYPRERVKEIENKIINSINIIRQYTL